MIVWYLFRTKQESSEIRFGMSAGKKDGTGIKRIRIIKTKNKDGTLKNLWLLR